MDIGEAITQCKRIRGSFGPISDFVAIDTVLADHKRLTDQLSEAVAALERQDKMLEQATAIILGPLGLYQTRAGTDLSIVKWRVNDGTNKMYGLYDSAVEAFQVAQAALAKIKENKDAS